MPETLPPAAEVSAPVEALKADDPTAGNEFIIKGPEQPDLKATEKKMKNVLKEGGKRGVEIEGAADMGGLQFFCTMMGSEITDGKVDLLIESMKAMNAISDPSEEERKGGAGKLGKMIFSFNEASLAAVAYVPSNKSDECSAKEWLADLVLNVANAATVEKIKTFESQGISERNWAAVQIDLDGAAGLFPIKMRDPAISVANNYLRKKGLFPDDDDEDDDDFVFGDEDFPS